ncbi:YopJ family acetyltransferase [Xenorhabdus bharatensis]|uniref:YopJ family acetyltransferase n=1 Tax=Xenorhabdus bharatensis TaxID=3136256 RepID=UPI0030F491CE
MYSQKYFQTPADYLNEIDKYLAENRQINHSSASHQDKIYLNKHWVINANIENPGLNLSVVNNINELPIHIEKFVNNAQTQARFIAFFSEEKYHAIAFDCCHIPNEGVSIIGIEPANSLQPGPCKEIATACQKLDFSLINTPVSLRILSSNQQNSTGECIIYSLSLAKKMHKESNKLSLLHQKNLNNELNITHKSNNVVIYPPEADKYLLPLFMKHCQSEKRMNNYLSSPLADFYKETDKRTYEVSKNRSNNDHKPLTLYERFSSYNRVQKVGEGNDEDDIKKITSSTSIFEKRRYEVNKLLKK